MAHSTGAGLKDIPVRKGFFFLYSQITLGPPSTARTWEGSTVPPGVSNFWCPTEPLKQVGLGLSASILDPACSTLTPSLYCLSLPLLSPTVAHRFPPFLNMLAPAVPSSHPFSVWPITACSEQSSCPLATVGLPHTAILTRPTSAEPLLSLVQFWSPNPVDILKIYLDGPPNCI